jgi:alpha-tubulin suppressor-like RCC1 family protein
MLLRTSRVLYSNHNNHNKNGSVAAVTVVTPRLPSSQLRSIGIMTKHSIHDGSNITTSAIRSIHHRHRQYQWLSTIAAAATATASAPSSSHRSSHIDDSNTQQQQQQVKQYLYMWGTDQYGTILTPKIESNSTTTGTSTTTTTPTNKKYDIPTLMDVTLSLWNDSRSTTASATNATTTANTTNSMLIDQVVCGPTETAILLSNGLCYVTGKNEYGQLGMSHTKPLWTPTCINSIFDAMYENDSANSIIHATTTTTASTAETVPTTKIRHVAFGTNFAAYLVEPLASSSSSTTTATDNNNNNNNNNNTGYDLYTCGFGGSTMAGVGCLGHGTIDGTTRPKLVESIYEDNVYVRQVVAGDAHCTILTNEHEVLTTGSGSYGRLGNFDTTDQLYFEPVEMVLPSSQSHIVQIAGGKSFTLALTNDGVVYGWGRNHKGQLGTGLGLAVDMYAMQSVPEPISDTSDLLMNTTIVKIAAGHSHAACLSDTGEVFHWGMSLHLEPVLVDSLLHTKIVDIVCGQDYTFAIDVHGHMYSFGNGNYTLGHGKDTRQLNQAKKIDAFRTGIIEEVQPPTADSGGANSSTNATKFIQRKIVHAAAGWKHAAVLLQEEQIEKPKDYSTIL